MLPYRWKPALLGDCVPGRACLRLVGMVARRSADVYQLKVMLNGDAPPIWRRVLVPGKHDPREATLSVAGGDGPDELSSLLFRVR
jgi:hypothetical protein